MSGIKTGAPGFVNPVDGKVYTVDTGGSENPPVNPILDNPDPGDMTVDNTVKDISKDTRITLGKYLSETTKGKVGSSKGVPNKYSIDAPTPATQPGTISDEKGFPLPLAPSQNSEKFADNLPSSFSKNYPGIKETFKKGKAEGSIPDGNTFLPGASSPNSSISSYVDSSIGSNEFNPPDPFLSPEIDPTNPKPATFEAKINDSNVLGNYSDSQKEQVTLSDLRNKASSVTSTNKFPVDSSNENLLPLTDEVTGFPTQINPVQTNESFFAKREDIKPLSNDPTITGFNKGKGSAAYDGNNLLKNVSGNLDAVSPGAKTAKYSSGQLDDTGSTSLDSSGLDLGGTGMDSNNPLQTYVGTRGDALSSMASKGRWSSGMIVGPKFNKILKLADGTEVSQLKMAAVGIGLTQRASAEIPAWKSDKTNPFNPLDNTAELKAVIPSVAQLGILKVNNSLLEAKDVLLSLEDHAEFDPEALTSIAPFDGQSWGNLTSPSEPFDDPSSIGLSVTMILLVLAIGELLGLFVNVPYEKVKTKASSGQRVLGAYKFVEGKKISNTVVLDLGILGFIKTNNSFATSLGLGSRAFFLGADRAEITGPELALGATGIGIDAIIGDGSSTGANLVVARTIIRSGLMMAQFFDMVNKRGKLSGAAGVKAAAGILKVIRSSKLVSAINVFAALGDTLLDRQSLRGQKTTDPSGNPVDISGFDAAPANSIAHSTVRKNRLTAGNVYDATLAWSAKRAPSMYLIPKNILALQRLDADSSLGSFKGALGLTRTDKDGKVKVEHQQTDNGRINNKRREDLEKILDAEYVPFYFHDVRTNEIVSFHAFLTALSDDYSASYDSVEGFGRVEPVKIYKGTTRKIGISFVVAATSDEDFQHMWFKINKLTTLVYPQYTAGRDLVGQNYQFKAPFSQMIGSSPLIRIRLGDLLRSNYSRFALSRLFGATDGDMVIPVSSEGNGKQDKNPDDIAKLDFLDQGTKGALAFIRRQKILDSFKKKTSSDAINLKIKIEKIKDYIQSSIGDVTNFSDTSLTVKAIRWFSGYEADEDIKNTVNGDAKIISVIDDDVYEVEVSYTTTENMGEGEDPIIDTNKTKIKVRREGIEPTDEEINTILKDEGYFLTDQQAYEELKNFMSPNVNAIVKSFESAGGKGLAGFVESINFDWYNQTTWNIDPDQTAPKMCKVTISFTPVHDISPGVDHQGYNRAPIYPVGSGMASVPFKTTRNGR
jgi:hypothetical protein